MKCSGCQGTGMKVSIRHLGPSMIQQMQHPCNECKGTGETINDKDRCPQCKGEKVVQEKKVLEVIVEKGMQNGQKITFPGEADEAVCFCFGLFTLFLFMLAFLTCADGFVLFVCLFCLCSAAGYSHWRHSICTSAEGTSKVQEKGRRSLL